MSIIVPVNKFSSKYKFSNFDKWDKLDDIEPSNKFLFNHKDLRSLNSYIEDGIDPVNKLSPKDNTSSDISPKNVGIVPVKKLLSMYKWVRPTKFANESETFPSNLFDHSSRWSVHVIKETNNRSIETMDRCEKFAPCPTLSVSNSAVFYQ